MNDELYFVDTNVVVYAHDNADTRKKEIARQLITDGIRTERIVISSQVLSEFFVTITKKIAKPLSVDKAQKEIELLSNLDVVEIDSYSVMRAIEVMKRYKISYWDSLIVSAAEYSQCKILYSEDMNHAQKIAGIKIINPFSD